VISSNLKYLDHSPQDWFKFDQISNRLQVFGQPKNV
jgi:hypothetical protein